MSEELEKRINQLEELVEKQQEKIQEMGNSSSEKKTDKVKGRKNKDLSRRDFIKKLSVGTIGLGAVLSPVSALNIRDTKFDVYTQDSGSVKSLGVDGNGDVEIPNGRLLLNNGLPVDFSSNDLAFRQTDDFVSFYNESGITDVLAVYENGNVEIPNGDIELGQGGNVKANVLEPSTFDNMFISAGVSDGDVVLRNGDNDHILRARGNQNVDIPNGDLNMNGNDIEMEDASIADESGTLRLGIGSTSTFLRGPDTSNKIVLNESESSLDFLAYEDEPIRFRDSTGAGVAFQYLEDPSKGTLELRNARLDLAGNNVQGANNYDLDPDIQGSLFRMGSADQFFRFTDSNSDDVLNIEDGGEVEIPSGHLSMEGNRVENAGAFWNIQVSKGDQSQVRRYENSQNQGFDEYFKSINITDDAPTTIMDTDEGNLTTGGMILVVGRQTGNYFTDMLIYAGVDGGVSRISSEERSSPPDRNYTIDDRDINLELVDNTDEYRIVAKAVGGST